MKKLYNLAKLPQESETQMNWKTVPSLYSSLFTTAYNGPILSCHIYPEVLSRNIRRHLLLSDTSYCFFLGFIQWMLTMNYDIKQGGKPSVD